MQALQTAVIEHTTAQGVHHDWLIEDPRLPHPAAADARLWTARVLPPPAAWAQLGRFELTDIPPHRRAYLHYQGPVSNNRGRVRRVAQGTCLVELWSDSRIALTLELSDIAMRLQMQRLSDERWLAVSG